MNKKKTQEKRLGIGFISEACRQVGVSRTVYETAKKSKREGKPLTRAQLSVLVKHKELIEEAEKQLDSL